MDCKAGDLGDKNSSEGVSYRGVNVDEGKGGIVGKVLVKFNSKILCISAKINNQSPQLDHRGSAYSAKMF